MVDVDAVIPRRMELYNSSEYLRYLIHLFHDDPLEQHKAQQVTLAQATKTATAQGKVPTIVQAGELIRQAISDKNGTPISHAYPMSPVFL